MTMLEMRYYHCIMKYVNMNYSYWIVSLLRLLANHMWILKGLLYSHNNLMAIVM